MNEDSDVLNVKNVIVILSNEMNEDLDVLKVEDVFVIDNKQYAVFNNNNLHTSFGLVVYEHDGTMRIADIVDDEEFNRVRDIYMQSKGN